MSARVALVAAFVAGLLVALQQRLNGSLGRSLHDPLLAAVVSFGSGLVVMAVLASRRRAQLPALRTLPRWTLLGGLMGAALVAVGATAAPRVGVALLTVAFVCGTTVGGLLVDRTSLGPGGRRPITPPRLAGAVLAVAAIALSAGAGLPDGTVGLLLLVVLAGALIPVQQALNSRVRGATGPVVATAVNFAVGTAGLLACLLVQALAGHLRADSWPGNPGLYAGGLLGCTFIAVAAVAVSAVGVLRFGLASTAGQLLGGVLLDLDRGVAASTLLAVALALVAVAVTGLQRTAVAA